MLTWFQIRLRRLSRLTLLPGFRCPGHVKASVGAMFGIGLTGMISAFVLTNTPNSTLVAPMGASAMLLYLMPTSPLSRPWAVVAGNASSVLVATVVASNISTPVLAAGLAVALAMLVMTTLRCVHPPGGAAALMVALNESSQPQQDWTAALCTISVNSVLLVSIALLFNRMLAFATSCDAFGPSRSVQAKIEAPLPFDEYD